MGTEAAANPRAGVEELTLQDYMQRVVEFNEAVQSRLLGFEASRRQRMAEMGAFEPRFEASSQYADRRKPNTDIARRTSGYAQAAIDAALNNKPQPPFDLYPYIYEERAFRYTSGVEMQTPFGTRLRVGATADDVIKNAGIVGDTSESGYATSVGLTVEQPLLKGLGYAANLANLRLAARQSEISFQEYRRELMQVVAEAELSYWELYYAQQELNLSRESVALAETLLKDSRASFDAGRGSKLDVLEAEAGLALRQARAREAHQRRVEALNKAAAFFGGSPREQNTDYVAVEAPVAKPVQTAFEEGILTAIQMNPDFLRGQLQKEQERIRYGYAKNQRLPELNLTAGASFYGHGFDWPSSIDDVDANSFPDWVVGVVFRAPIWGDVRGRNEKLAAKLRLMEAERAESNLLTQLRAGCDTAEQRIESNLTTTRSLQSVVEFRVTLLDTRLQSLQVGRMDARSVLEAEQDLFLARLEQLKSEVEYQRALLEMQLLTGSLLQLRGLELTFSELEYRTRKWSAGDTEKSPQLSYTVPDLSRLPASEPMPFKGDTLPAPWFGTEWDAPAPDFTAPYNEEPTAPTDTPAERDRPRRFDGSHIP